jgi:hypothetical protein
VITALPYIETKGLTLNDMDALMEKVRSQMVQVYEQVSTELKTALPQNYPGLVGFE